MKALDRALLRDLVRLRAQVLTISLVVACGVSAFVALGETIDVIELARDDYVRTQRLADLFVHLERAPRALLAELALIPGVAELDGRAVGDVTAFVEGQREPAQVHLVSVDPSGRAPLDAIRILRGRMPAPGREDEVVLNAPFAEATHLGPGDPISAVVNGRLRRLHVVGIGISPEFVFQLPPGAVSPDDARYGVAWMPRAPVEVAFDLGGAFNDLLVRLAPGADRAAVIAALDRRLAALGGRGAYGREDQYSYRSLQARIGRMRVMLVFVPALFLLVAAFVLAVALGRLVQSQREQIGTLKAFGYGNGRLATHYLAFALLAVAPGAAAGVAGGLAMARALIAVYVRYFRLPLDGREAGWHAVVWAVAAVAAAAALGALRAMRRVAGLDPAEAMRAPAPPAFRRTALTRLRPARRIPPALLMIARNMRSAPLRAAGSVAALAFAAALYVSGAFLGDTLDALVRHQFREAMREDLAVAFSRPLPPSACGTLRALDGVTACEPLSLIPVRASFGPRRERVNLTRPAEPSRLRRVVDTAGREVPVPASGLLASRRLLEKLGASRGDAIVLETVEGRPRTSALPVRAVVDDAMGVNLYASGETVERFTRAAPTMSTALLRVAPGREAEVVQRLSGMPVVIGTTSPAEQVAGFEQAVAQSMRALTGILAILAAALAIAVVYNGARVALAERARDLATLRVLGFTPAEVTRVVLGEMALALGVGLPLGLLVGRALATLAARALASDEFRLAPVVAPRTYLLAAAVVVGASAWSALHVRRLVDHLDLIGVLKTRS